MIKIIVLNLDKSFISNREVKKPFTSGIKHISIGRFCIFFQYSALKSTKLFQKKDLFYGFYCSSTIFDISLYYKINLFYACGHLVQES